MGRNSRAGEGVCRLAVTEAPIDALSLAAIDDRRADTLYLATGGGAGSQRIVANVEKLARAT
jgi:Toprim-like